MHGHTGVVDIRPDKRAGAVVRLQITPEKSLVDTYLIGGEAFQRDIHRLLKHFRPDILLEEDGQPVYGRKIPSLQSGIYDGGQIQPVPVPGADGRFDAILFYMETRCHRFHSFPGSDWHKVSKECLL